MTQQGKQQPTFKEWVAYWTLIPVLIGSVAFTVSMAPLWVAGVISFKVAIVAPLFVLSFINFWLYFFGEAVIPAETYRKRYR